MMAVVFIRKCSDRLESLFILAASRFQSFRAFRSQTRATLAAETAHVDLETEAFLADESVDPNVKALIRRLLAAHEKGEVVAINPESSSSSLLDILPRDSPFLSTTTSEIFIPSSTHISDSEHDSESDSDAPQASSSRLTSLTVPSSGIKILSLDGGGVRGLSPLIILSMLQDKVNAMGFSDVPPCKLFDLIVGTSTGGIIAILLGRCGYTVVECIEIYKLFAKEIFNYSLLSKGARYTATNSRLPADTLVAKMETVIGDRFGDKRTLFVTDPQNGCKVAVVASNFDRLDGGEPITLRSYNSNLGPVSNGTIVEVARATSAAPSFFAPQIIDGIAYVDGGFGTNNPSLVALAEANSLWPGERIDAFVSIGTGTSRHISADDLNKASLNFTTSSHIPHERIVQNGFLDPDQYFRFNVPNLGTDVALDGWQKLDQIVDSTTKYLKMPHVEAETMRCAKALGLSSDRN